MKNYFIANGEVLNTNMSIEEIESRVQESLDEYTSGMAQFMVKEISEKEVRMFFVRDFDYDPDVPIIFDADMALISGNRRLPATTSRRISNDLSLEFCREEFLYWHHKLHQVL